MDVETSESKKKEITKKEQRTTGVKRESEEKRNHERTEEVSIISNDVGKTYDLKTPLIQKRIAVDQFTIQK